MPINDWDVPPFTDTLQECRNYLDYRGVVCFVEAEDVGCHVCNTARVVTTDFNRQNWIDHGPDPVPSISCIFDPSTNHTLCGARVRPGFGHWSTPAKPSFHDWRCPRCVQIASQPSTRSAPV